MFHYLQYPSSLPNAYITEINHCLIWQHFNWIVSVHIDANICKTNQEQLQTKFQRAKLVCSILIKDKSLATKNSFTQKQKLSMKIRYPCYNLNFLEALWAFLLISQAIHLYQVQIARESAVFQLVKVKTCKCSCDHFPQLFISREHACFTTWSDQQQGKQVKQVQIRDWFI